MYLKTMGLVLRVTNYNDHDALLTLMTPEQGKLTVKARGLRRKNSPLSAPCQLFAYGEFTLFEYKNYYTVNEAHSVELFMPLRKDLCKLALGTYFVQVADVLSQEDSPTSELCALTLNCLYALSNLDFPNELIKAVFELRCACLAGYMPDLSGCHSCAKPFADRFDISAGRLECSSCRSFDSDGIRLPVSVSVICAMRYICTCDPKALFRFTLGEDSVQQLSQVTESYLTTQLERGFSSLDFYKSLIIT